MTSMPEIFTAADGKPRCHWCAATAGYIAYHDNEWGLPIADDRLLFEKICLEGFQSGLSWRTILEKRENFRHAFAGFDFHQVAEYTAADARALLQDESIIRHRGKIEATINNARRAREMVKQEGSLAAFVWRFEPARPPPRPRLVSATPESAALAEALKKSGWKFVGPTTAYAFMQAMGLVNDHAERCYVRAKVEQARKKFIKP